MNHDASYVVGRVLRDAAKTKKKKTKKKKKKKQNGGEANERANEPTQDYSQPIPSMGDIDGAFLSSG